MKVCTYISYFVQILNAIMHRLIYVALADFQIRFGSFFHDLYLMMDTKYLPYYFKGSRQVRIVKLVLSTSHLLSDNLIFLKNREQKSTC